jgi:signal transduction histidine kinase
MTTAAETRAASQPEIRNRARRRGLTWRVLAVLALATAAPTLAVGALAIHRARDNLEHEVVRGNLALIRALGAALDGTLQAARRDLDLAAAAWADERATVQPRDGADAAATQRLLRRLRREVPLFAKVSIFDVDGVLVAGDVTAAETGAGAHTFGGYIGDVAFVDGQPRIRAVTQARSRTGELLGSFVAEIDLGFVAQTLRQAPLGPGARLLVVDGEGVPVARSDSQASADARSLRGVHPAVDLALGSADEGSVEAGGNVAVYRNLSGYQSLRGVRWAILLEQPERQAYALAHETTRDTWMALALALTAALLLGTFLATRLTRPLRALAHRADAIAGAAHVPATDGSPRARASRGPGEIGQLAERLEEMAERLAERDRLKDALARGDRLAAVGTMSASLAHEINNPLTTVLGYAKLLLEDKPEGHSDRPGLSLIAEESERMQRIVRRLLDYARADTNAGHAESDDTARDTTSDVNRLAEHTRDLLQPQLQRRQVELALELAPALPPARADTHSVQQILVNLAQNAAQAVAQGGRVTVRTGLAPGAIAVLLEVLDTGPGVPLADRERIFDPFFTTKAAGAGTGLGLAVVKHLVSRCGGSVAVADNPAGRGACFRVVLPIAE